jgi:hypothetical protein
LYQEKSGNLGTIPKKQKCVCRMYVGCRYVPGDADTYFCV